MKLTSLIFKSNDTEDVTYYIDKPAESFDAITLTPATPSSTVTADILVKEPTAPLAAFSIVRLRVSGTSMVKLTLKKNDGTIVDTLEVKLNV